MSKALFGKNRLLSQKEVFIFLYNAQAKLTTIGITAIRIDISHNFLIDSSFFIKNLTLINK